MNTRREFLIGATATAGALLMNESTHGAESVTTHVYVVNTQDASVSLVNLAGMKEMNHPDIHRYVDPALHQSGIRLPVRIANDPILQPVLLH